MLYDSSLSCEGEVISLLKEKIKWKILNIEFNNGKLKVTADFFYGFKEVYDPETDELTGYEAQGNRETLESPVVLTSEQIKLWLDTYWGNKYGPLDAQTQLLSEIEQMKGYEQLY